MSRIYDALKRAAGRSKLKEPPPMQPQGDDVVLGTPEWPSPAAPSMGVPPEVPGPATEKPVPEGPRQLPPKEPPQPRPPEAPQVLHGGDVVTAGDLLAYRKSVREALRVKFALEIERMAEAGKYPFGGNWLTLREIRRLRLSMRWRELQHLLEILLLFFVMLLIAFGSYRGLTGFLLPP